MKKTILIALATLVLASGAFAQLNLKLEGAGHLALGDGNAFLVEGGGILHMNDMLALRTTILSLQLDPMHLYLGTGGAVDGLVFFDIASSITPYGLAGLHINLMENYTNFSINLGGGAEFGSGVLRPFAELVIGIYTWSYEYDSAWIDDDSGSDTSIGIRGGVRFDLGGK